MLNTPFLYKSFAAIRKTIIGVGLLVGFILCAELIRCYLMLNRFNPIAAWVFGILVLVGGTWTFIRIAGASSDRRIFSPPPSPEEEATEHGEMVDYCKYLVLLLKRLAENPILTGDLPQQSRQQAYNLQDVLGAHPLKDDLSRAISKTVSGFLLPLLAQLRREADTHARERMRAVVDDVIEPPFPVINPFVVMYIQVVLVSRIADIYFARLSLLEYYRIMRDVFLVVTKGRFFKLGQSLFAGVYANSPPLGRTIFDVGQSLTSIWLTRIVSRAAVMRCEALSEWDVEYNVQVLEDQVVALLADTKDCFVRDAMPTLRLRIRHSAPPDTIDVAAFSESITEGIARAIDGVVKGYQSQSPEKTIASARKTYADVTTFPDEVVEAPREERRTRRRRTSSRKGMFRIFHTFGQRIKYTVSPGHKHR